jgi:hypothetical protein
VLSFATSSSSILAKRRPYCSRGSSLVIFSCKTGGMRMPSGMVVVPATILLDPQLSLNARLGWIFSQAEGYQHAPAQLTPRLLKANCGLTRPTIRRALRELLEAGLLSQSVQPAVTTARLEIPCEAAESSKLCPRKIAYSDYATPGGREQCSILPPAGPRRWQNGALFYCDARQERYAACHQTARNVLSDGGQTWAANRGCLGCSSRVTDQ